MEWIQIVIKLFERLISLITPFLGSGISLSIIKSFNYFSIRFELGGSLVLH